MDGPKDERSKKKEDVKTKKEEKAESESIHTMDEVDGKLFADWQEYSTKKPKKRMQGTMKADSEASATTNSSVDDLESRLAIGEEERVTWGGRFSFYLHFTFSMTIVGPFQV